jgi:hypothetical protein
MKAVDMKILFDGSGNPHSKAYIKKCVEKFGQSYSRTVQEIIRDSQDKITEEIFLKNTAKLMSNFKMTRRGPFKGVGFIDGKVIDPYGILAASWGAIGSSAIDLKMLLIGKPSANRARVLVEVSENERNSVTTKLWTMFKKLLPLCMSDTSWGVVAASKLLFSIFPEVALPVDNNQWRKLFQTVDYSDIISLMAAEIMEWEKLTGQRINDCGTEHSTLPAIYNVMAMDARDIESAMTTQLSWIFTPWVLLRPFV